MDRQAARRILADKTCIDCGTTKNLELDRRNASEQVNHRVWSWSTARLEAELAKYEIRCSSCRRKRLADHQTRHGTRGRYERAAAVTRAARPSRAATRSTASSIETRLPPTARTSEQAPHATNGVRHRRRLLRPQGLESKTVACPDRREQAADPTRHVRHQGRSCDRPGGAERGFREAGGR
jgi:hypothetical protein